MVEWCLDLEPSSLALAASPFLAVAAAEAAQLLAQQPLVARNLSRLSRRQYEAWSALRRSDRLFGYRILGAVVASPVAVLMDRMATSRKTQSYTKLPEK